MIVLFAEEIQFLITFCWNALCGIYDMAGTFNIGYILLGFILIWVVIDNLVPKG